MMVQKRWTAAIVVFTLSFILAGGIAESRPPGFGKKFGVGATDDFKKMKEDLSQQTDETVKQISAARITFINAQEKILDAIGLKAEYAEKLAEARALSEGNTSVSNLTKAQKISEEANAAITKKLEEGVELGPESRKLFVEGVVLFAGGVMKEKSQIDVTSRLVELSKQVAEQAPPHQKPAAIVQGKTATELAAMVPGDVKQGTSTLKTMSVYCEKQQIELPKDATSLLGDDE